MHFRQTLRIVSLVTAPMLLSACGGLVPFGSGSGEIPPSRGDVGVQGTSSASPSGPSSAGACIGELGATGARFATLPDTYKAPGCNQLGAVRLNAISGDNSDFGMTNLGPVKCEVAKAFAGWARFGVDRAARQILGSPLARIETMGSYSCRNVAGTSRKSAHARAEAIDVSAFVLADGRRIVLLQDWDRGTREEREFLRVVHRSACKRFGTVLGPEYNAAHADHFHLEGTGAKFCR